MNRIKNLLLSVLLVAMVLIYLYYQGQLDRALSVFTGYVDPVIYQTGTNQARVYYALGVDADGNETVTRSGSSGEEHYLLTELGIPEEFRPADSYLTENGMLIVGGRNVDENQLYLIDFAEKHADIILSVYSHTIYEDTFSAISEDSTGYAFMVNEESGRQVYIYESINKVLREGEFYPKDGIQPLMVYPSGRIALKEGDPAENTDAIRISFQFGKNAEENLFPANNRVWAANGSLWLLDKDRADLWYLGQQKSGLVCNMRDFGMGKIVSVTASGAGLTVFTDTGRSVLLVDTIDTEDITGMLQDTGAGKKSLILLVAGSLLAVFLFFLLLEFYRSHIHSFVVIGLILAMGMITITLMLLEQIVVQPQYRQMTVENVTGQLGYICSQDLQMESFLGENSRENGHEKNGIHDLLLGHSSDTALMHFYRKDGEIFLQRTEGTDVNLSATKYPASFARAIEQTFQEGNVYAEFTASGRQCAAVAVKSDDTEREWGSVVITGNREVTQISRLYEAVSSCIIWGSMAACIVVILMLLLTLRSRVTELSEECDSFAEGKNVNIVPDERDELGALALKIENAIRTKEQKEQECGSLRDTYRRFLPAGILEFFGTSHEEELKPGDSMEKEVILMQIRFFLPDELANTSDKEKCMILNRFLSGVLSCLRKNGGYPIRFDISGVEAIFPVGSKTVVSTAIEIRQNMTAGNKMLYGDAEKIEMFIGAEKTMYRLALCGDEEQVKMLVFRESVLENEERKNRFREMRNSTVCSEVVVAGELNLLKRYLGSIETAEGPQKFYEIFKGDPYDVRLAKSYSQELFEEGVRLCEEKKTGEARKRFLRVLERNVHDTAALCYLRITEEGRQNKTEV